MEFVGIIFAIVFLSAQHVHAAADFEFEEAFRICERKSIFGKDTYRCPEAGDPPQNKYCCGDDTSQRCCERYLGVVDGEWLEDNNQAREIQENDPVWPRIAYKKSYTKRNFGSGPGNFFARSAGKIVGGVLAAIVVGVVLIILCCCFCSWCLISKMRKRRGPSGHQTHAANTATTTFAAQPAPAASVGATPYPAQPSYNPGYPAQPAYPPYPAGQQNTTAPYPTYATDNPPPYSEATKPAAFNPAYPQL